MKIVVIPATYNEKGNIERLVNVLEDEVFPKIKNHKMHILVADDNSPDGTGNEVRKLMKKWKNLDISSGERKGLGAAYIRAMSYAIEALHADVVISIDGDMQFDPREIPHYLKKIENGYDIVTGTRYSEGGTMPANWPFYRKVFSIAGNTLVRLITGRFYLHDWTGGFRAYKKEAFLKEREKLRLYSGYTFQVAALYKAILDGYRIAEVPIHFQDRTLGYSKIAPLEYIVNLLLYVTLERLLELKRFIKFLIIGGMGFFLQLFAQELSVRIGLASAIAIFISPLIFELTKHHALYALRDAVAGGIGAEAAILSNFTFNNFWTFKDTSGVKERSNIFIRLIKFNFTSIASIFIQASSIWIFVRILGESLTVYSYTLPTRVVVVIPTIIFLIVPINYLIYNKIIWKTQFLKHEKSS